MDGAGGSDSRVVDDLSSGRAGNVPSGADLEQLDISDRAALGAVLDAARPEAIYHLGAQSSVTVSVDVPGFVRTGLLPR